ncbi:hypothetical protein L7F22_005020 [Adiantum nelumboides]|nr:hypothetical protein [Adiantum nelumboides]
MVCPACGSQMIARLGHQCDPLQRQCLDIIRAIMKLCGAYIHTTCVDIEQNPTKKCCLNDNERSHWMHGNDLTFEQCKWFCCKGFKIEPPFYGGQQSLPRFKGSSVDDLAPKAMQDIMASVSRVLDDNQGFVSSIVGALLCSNGLPYILLKSLEKNDSLMDIAAHSNLYRALLAFMRARSGSYDFLPLLCSLEAKHETTETQSRWETPDFVLEEFSKLFKQLMEFIHEQTMFSSSPSNAKSATICSKQADVDLNCSNHGKQLSLGNVKTTKGESVSFLPSAALVEAYKEALQPLQFDEACLLPTHYFWLVARNNNDSLMLNKRQAHTIGEEITLFNTRLPLEWDSSIFLCMDEERMDVLRALIIGPKDTPCENGVFLFDILLEATYPDKPPKVHFLTTRGGKVRFNPNLYENGTVCLSILGAWNDGPGWKAGQSSIMQVLVSIQGLVLVANPYYNEPGDLYRALLAFMRAVSGSYDFLPSLFLGEAKHETTETQSHWETPSSIMAKFCKLFKQVQFMLLRVEQLNSIQSTHRRTREQVEFDCRLSSLMEDIKASREAKHESMEIQSRWETSRFVLAEFSKLFKEVQLMLRRVEQQNSGQSTHRRTRKQLEFDCRLTSLMEDIKVSSAVPSAALVEAYKEALRPLQFDKACLLATHYFRLVARNSESLKLDKQRARIIGKEMTLFNTRLSLEWDSSIFLRMDEQRMDVLWALIIGQKDTPYENGVFLFDILLEATYSEKPPKVHFLTTGGGKVRFNPNLYKNGTVCLSILGTWNDGPRWKARQSSIMQVLVLIQGLVLVTDPYYNEPGYKRGPNHFAADEYILNQCLNTIEHSMLPALSCPDPLFLRVIHTHFCLKAVQILSQCTA